MDEYEEYEYAGFIFLVQDGKVLRAKPGQHHAAYKDKHKRAAQQCYMMKTPMMSLPALQKFIPTAENYRLHHNKTMKCGRSIVMVTYFRTESRAGSWERGFKFSNSEWAMLLRMSDKACSFDHGKTWHANAKAAFRATKGKMRLKIETHGEFAFEGIQKINRAYEGPGYKWRR